MIVGLNTIDQSTIRNTYQESDEQLRCGCLELGVCVLNICESERRLRDSTRTDAFTSSPTAAPLYNHQVFGLIPD